MPKLGIGFGLHNAALAPLPVPWSPSEISTIFWYDAADESTITATGNEVTQMLDKSGNNVTLTVINQSRIGPDTGTRTLNGLNVLEYTKTALNTNQILENDSFSQAQPFCIAGIVRLDNEGITTSEQDFLFSGTESSTDRVAVRRMTTDQWQIYTTKSGTTTKTVPSPAVALEDTNFLLSFYFGGTNTSTIRINGTPNGSGIVNDTPFSSLNIGGNFAEDQSLDGFIAELVAFADPNDQEIVEGYLAWKWGMQGDLDGNHRYKNSRPYVV